MISTAVSLQQVARVLGIKTQFQDLRGGRVLFLPPHIGVLAQGNDATSYSETEKLTLTGGAGEAASVYGFGSPIHRAVQELLPVNGDGVGSTPITVYPLPQGTTPADGDIAPTGTPTAGVVFAITIGGKVSQNIAIAAADSVATMVANIVAGINGTLDMPVIATDNASTSVVLTAKTNGTVGNDISISISNSAALVAAAVTLTVTAMANGAGDPSAANIATALALMGGVWVTHMVVGLPHLATGALDALQTHGDGRWGSLEFKPYVAFWATNEATAGTLVALGDGRKDDKINSLLAFPGAPDIPFVYAARAVARIANLAGSNPPHDYARKALTGPAAGADGVQYDTTARDLLVKAGVSTVEVVDGVFELSDTVTFYHPDVEPIPGYRYVVDIARLQNIIFNIALIFNADEWDGAPLLPDATPTTNPLAKKPKMARAQLASMTDSLALAAIVSDPDTIKAGILADISGSNPKRIDVKYPAILSGNSNIRSVDLDFGFFFGS